LPYHFKKINKKVVQSYVHITKNAKYTGGGHQGKRIKITNIDNQLIIYVICFLFKSCSELYFENGKKMPTQKK
jgi:hypothetical protein